jgi:rRNA biogenesis protein RRP5
LGQITEIGPHEITLALPNDLVGHVPITAISDTLTTRLEEAQDAMDEDEDDNESHDQTIDLSSLFAVGQYVRACVMSTFDEESSQKGRRRIELSLRPQDTNPSLSSDDIVISMSLMASIVSVEERGCVMDLGLQDLGITGFLTNDKIAPSLGPGRLQPGKVFLCLVAGRGPNKKVVHLTTMEESFRNPKARPYDATTINSFLPGTLVEVLVSEIMVGGIAGKLLGHLDVVADRIHSGLVMDSVDLESKYKLGEKVNARIICNFPSADDPKLGVSFLPHVLTLTSKSVGGDKTKAPTDALPLSTIIDKCVVRYVEPATGLYVDLGVEGARGFVHISRVKDGKEDALYETSGPFKLESRHKGRVLRYNPMDGLFSVSFQQSIIDQKYLRLEDVPVGAVVTGRISKVMIGEDGVKGLLVQISEHISGLVPAIHLSDVQLSHPERVFHEGGKVKARVFSTDLHERHMRLTLKKTLISSDLPILQDMAEASPGMRVLGTIIKIQPSGAVVQFYGSLKGYLPKGEMSEAFIRDPAEHFKVGQSINVYVQDVDLEKGKLTVSCKDPAAFGLEKQTALLALKVGDMVSGKVTEKTEDIVVELDNGLRAVLPGGHLSDGVSENRVRTRLNKINVGQTLTDLMVIDKNVYHKSVNLTRKTTLIDAFKEAKLLVNLADANVGDIRAGYIRSIQPSGIAVQFGGEARGFIPKHNIPEEAREKPDFGMRRLQSITVVVVHVMPEQGKMTLAIPGSREEDQLYVGSITEAKITKVRATQLNVEVNGKLQGRVDISGLFDDFEEIEKPKAPLAKFKKGDILKVRVLGVHDAKNHKYLPISHRSTHQVLELTAKPSSLKTEILQPLTIDKVKAGSAHIAFVNRSAGNHVWVHLSPFVSARINAMDLSDEQAVRSAIPSNFPIGTAILTRVLAVDVETGRVDLSARSDGVSGQAAEAPESFSWDEIKPNVMLSATVTKTTERQVMVQVGRIHAFPIHLPDLADDFSEANPLAYKKWDAIKVSVVEVDKPNKKLRLSVRPSRILSSNSPVVDREIMRADQISKGDIIRGFIKNVTDQGVFVNLGGRVDAHVKVTNLSDKFLKDWKESFQVDQVVKGRVIMADHDVGKIELGLKETMLADDWAPKLEIRDLKPGQILTGTVRKVEQYGAFVEIDNSQKVRGLCHRTEMSDEKVADATKLYKEGDVVKVYVTNVDAPNRRIKLSLKASYFVDESDEEHESSDGDSETGGAALGMGVDDDGEEADDAEAATGGDVLLNGTAVDEDDPEDDVGDEQSDNDNAADEGEDEDGDVAMANGEGAAGSKYDWEADAFARSENGSAEETEPVAPKLDKKKRRRKTEIEVDRTAELDARGPQNASDYERLLLSQPDSSELWMAYMAHQMEVSELEKAREVAERAIKTINIREETEKLNVWIAYLNLEMAYGTNEKFDDVFKRACQYNDEREVCSTLVSNYIRLDKKEVRCPDTVGWHHRPLTRLQAADTLFQTMVKKFGSKSPEIWLNYAHFLFVSMEDPARGRALLSRAQQSLEKRHHLHVATRFAALEWRSPKGDPEKGRTQFEGILSLYPKKDDIWRQLLDAERTAPNAEADAVRAVFERRLKANMKQRQAEKWFDRWAAWEAEVDPDGVGQETVLRRKEIWVIEMKAKKDGKVEDELMEGMGDD